MIYTSRGKYEHGAGPQPPETGGVIVPGELSGKLTSPFSPYMYIFTQVKQQRGRGFTVEPLQSPLLKDPIHGSMTKACLRTPLVPPGGVKGFEKGLIGAGRREGIQLCKALKGACVCQV